MEHQSDRPGGNGTRLAATLPPEDSLDEYIRLTRTVDRWIIERIRDEGSCNVRGQPSIGEKVRHNNDRYQRAGCRKRLIFSPDRGEVTLEALHA